MRKRRNSDGLRPSATARLNRKRAPRGCSELRPVSNSSRLRGSSSALAPAFAHDSAAVATYSRSATSSKRDTSTSKAGTNSRTTSPKKNHNQSRIFFFFLISHLTLNSASSVCSLVSSNISRTRPTKKPDLKPPC
jgi:hypothetical protein